MFISSLTINYCARPLIFTLFIAVVTMFNCHQIVFCLLCLKEAASVSSPSSFDDKIPDFYYFRSFQLHTTSFTDFYLETVKILDSKSTYGDVNATLQRRGREHPTFFFEIDLHASMKDYEVTSDLFLPFSIYSMQV